MSEILDKNQKLLEIYKGLCNQKGLTNKSIKAFCGNDLPMFLKFIGEKKLKKVTHRDIEAFFDYCFNARKNKDATVERKRTALNCFFSTLIKKDYLDMKNPMDKIDNIKVSKVERDYVRESEVKQMLQVADDAEDLRGGALIALLFSSGCRLEEIHQLNRTSLDFETKQFRVLGKGDKERTCIFSDDAAERIQKYLASRKDSLEPLFVSRQHNRWSEKGIQGFVAKIGEMARLKKHIHPHLFRHGCAMFLLSNGVPIERVSQILGHESINTTQIYLHLNIGDVQGDVDKIYRKSFDKRAS